MGRGAGRRARHRGGGGRRGDRRRRRAGGRADPHRHRARLRQADAARGVPAAGPGRQGHHRHQDRRPQRHRGGHAAGARGRRHPASSPPRARSSASTPPRCPRRAATRWACASSTSMPTIAWAPSPASTPSSTARRSAVSRPCSISASSASSPTRSQRALADKGGAELIREILARDAERRRLLQGGRGPQGPAQPRLGGDRPGQAARRGRVRRAGADARGGRPHQGARRRAQDHRRARSKTLLAQVPNVPHPSVPRRQERRRQRRGPPLGHAARRSPSRRKPHEEIGEALGLLDLERAAKIAKARFTVMWGARRALERALAQFMLDLHTREHGYTELWVPHLVNGDTMLEDGPAPEVRGAALQDGGGRRAAARST